MPSLSFTLLVGWKHSLLFPDERYMEENFLKPVCLKMALFPLHLIDSFIGDSLLHRK